MSEQQWIDCKCGMSYKGAGGNCEVCGRDIISDKAEPKRYKIIASAEIINYKPAHLRYESARGEGSSIRTAATDAVDNLFKTAKLKALRNKLPIKVILQTGD